MEWIEAKIYTTTAGVEPVTGRLLQMGVNGFAIQDSADFEEFLDQTTPNWDYVDESLMSLKDAETSVTLYLPHTIQGMETLEEVRREMAVLKSIDSEDAFGRLEISLENLNEEDWATAWKKYYHALRIGKRIMVCPSWETCESNPDDIVLTLDPGMAFGTGTHNTTSLCMELLEKYACEGKTMLDVGCGSGILAITAALLGCHDIQGVDIDETAVKVARENAGMNNVSEKIQFHQGDLGEKITGCYDVICANIVADVIIRLLPDIPRFLKPDGVFICSGIIDDRKEDVLCALREHKLEQLEIKEAGGWVAIANKFA